MNTIIQWANENSGFLSLMIFISTLFLGWVSGIFQSLMKKPRFKLKILSGPTICTTFTTGKKFNGYDIHRTAISIYLGVSNVGTAASIIENVWIGYHWHIKPISWLWYRYRVLWFWIKKPIHTMEDFQYDFGDRVKIYPSLLQGVSTIKKSPETYLEVGKRVNGVVYFEQDDSWGGFFPTSSNSKVKLRIIVIDTFGKKFKKTFWAPYVTLEEAQKYNPAFGASFAIMRGELKGIDEVLNNGIQADTLSTDAH